MSELDRKIPAFLSRSQSRSHPNPEWPLNGSIKNLYINVDRRLIGISYEIDLAVLWILTEELSIAWLMVITVGSRQSRKDLNQDLVSWADKNEMSLLFHRLMKVGTTLSQSPIWAIGRTNSPKYGSENRTGSLATKQVRRQNWSRQTTESVLKLAVLI